MSRMRNRLACATGSVPKINNKYFALPMHTSQALLNVSATVNAVELEFTFRSICLLMCLETGAYSECRMMRSIVSNHSHMVRIFSVRILAVGSHRQFAVCGSHFRVRQFAVRILEQPLPQRAQKLVHTANWGPPARPAFTLLGRGRASRFLRST